MYTSTPGSCKVLKVWKSIEILKMPFSRYGKKYGKKGISLNQGLGRSAILKSYTQTLYYSFRNMKTLDVRCLKQKKTYRRCEQPLQQRVDMHIKGVHVGIFVCMYMTMLANFKLCMHRYNGGTFGAWCHEKIVHEVQKKLLSS